MKIRNFVFAGFAAAILSGTAHAAVEVGSTKVASTNYVKEAIATRQPKSTQLSVGNASGGWTSLKDAEIATTSDIADLKAHVQNGAIHVTADQKTAWDAKQDALDAGQLAAVNSGVTKDKVDSYDDLVKDAESYATKDDIKDMETKTNAAATYQPKGDYAEKATTLAGYGITNAYTKTETDAELAKKQDALAAGQLAAVNSGVTSDKVTSYDTHIGNADIHVTTDDKTKWNAVENKADKATTLEGYGITDAYTKGAVDTELANKQDVLSTDQLAAVNSGITAEKVATYDAFDEEKQDALDAGQLAAVNSGVTSDKVTSYDTHIGNADIHVTTDDKTKWNAVENKANKTDVYAADGTTPLFVRWADVVDSYTAD